MGKAAAAIHTGRTVLEPEMLQDVPYPLGKLHQVRLEPQGRIWRAADIAGM